MTQYTSSNLLVRAWHNECDGWLALGNMPESAYRVERHDSITYAWWEDDPGAIDNYVMIGHDYIGDLHPVVATITERITTSQSPTVIRFIDSDNGRRWAEQADQLGFTSSGTVPIMACPLQGSRPSIHIAPEVNTRTVSDELSYQEAFDVIHAVYGGDVSITRFFNPWGLVRLYTGHWDGTPASSATVWPFAGVAGIYSVATLQEYRHRGLALATLQHALNDATAEGYDLAILRTADELIPFYARLGFSLVGRLNSFAKADGSLGGASEYLY